MRTLTVVVLSIALLPFAASTADTIEVEVHGLTCAFCVDGLQRQLMKLPDIEQVDVSLKSKIVRITSGAAHVDTARIREIVIDSGFTPVNIRVIEDED